MERKNCSNLCWYLCKCSMAWVRLIGKIAGKIFCTRLDCLWTRSLDVGGNIIFFGPLLFQRRKTVHHCLWTGPRRTRSFDVFYGWGRHLCLLSSFLPPHQLLRWHLCKISWDCQKGSSPWCPCPACCRRHLIKYVCLCFIYNIIYIKYAPILKPFGAN